MDHAEQVRLLKELMHQLDTDTTVDAGGMMHNPVSTYTCPERHKQEWTTFFQEYPQCIGMSADLPEPGTFITTQDFGKPVLATRDENGQFRAFLNVCRHRGAIVERESSGKRTRFACPFHNWTYGSDGALVTIPKAHHFGEIDQGCHGLVELPAEELYGFLWVHPDPNGAIDGDTIFEGYVEDFERWDFGSLIKTGEDRYDMRLNWKLALDTFGETYHFNYLHRNTLALDFYGGAQAHDERGRNHRMILCLRAIDDLHTIPEDQWHICFGGFPVYWLFPNVVVNVGAEGIYLVRAYPDPDDPAKSISNIGLYASQLAIQQEPEMQQQRSEGFAQIVRDEDYLTGVTSQTGAESGAQDYVIFGRNEPTLHHYHQTYRRMLGMEPLPLITP